ncbi:hypothetical protein WJX77_006332 [Trebouxia sp. C0004]
MGFKADADQGTETEQAGQNKLQDGAPLPVEKPDQTQQSAIDVIDTEGRCTRGEDPTQFGLSGHSSSPMHGGDWTALRGWALHGNISQSGASRQGLQVDDSHAMQQLQVIAWANKACDSGYPDTCLHWAGFLAKLAIHYDRVSAGHADVGIMNRLTSRARSLKALGESRASDRMSKGKRVHGITGVLIEWGMDEYRLIETVTERLRTVNDAIRCLDLLSNASAAAGTAPAVVPVPIKIP